MRFHFTSHNHSLLQAFQMRNLNLIVSLMERFAQTSCHFLSLLSSKWLSSVGHKETRTFLKLTTRTAEVQLLIKYFTNLWKKSITNQWPLQRWKLKYWCLKDVKTLMWVEQNKGHAHPTYSKPKRAFQRFQAAKAQNETLHMGNSVRMSTLSWNNIFITLTAEITTFGGSHTHVRSLFKCLKHLFYF